MKLSTLILIFSVSTGKKEKKPKPPKGCNPDDLGHYAEKHAKDLKAVKYVECSDLTQAS